MVSKPRPEILSEMKGTRKGVSNTCDQEYLTSSAFVARECASRRTGRPPKLVTLLSTAIDYSFLKTKPDRALEETAYLSIPTGQYTCFRKVFLKSNDSVVYPRESVDRLQFLTRGMTRR